MTAQVQTFEDAAAQLRESKKFREWQPTRPARRTKLPPHIEVSSVLKDEKHYTPAELAEMWGISAETVRVLFRDEPGVLKIGSSATKYKRGYKTLRIPESVAERVHTRLSE
jgi:hypothetical protein